MAFRRRRRRTIRRLGRGRRRLKWRRFKKRVIRAARSYTETQLAYHQTAVNTLVQLSFNGLMIQIPQIAQGVTKANRQGNKIWLKGLYIRFVYLANNEKNTALRLCVVRSKLGNTAPTTATFAQGVYGDIYTLDPNFFEVIRDIRWTNENGNVQDNKQVRKWIYVPLRRVQTFVTNGSVVGSDPDYYVWMWSSDDPGAPGGIAYELRLAWKDL